MHQRSDSKSVNKSIKIWKIFCETGAIEINRKITFLFGKIIRYKDI